MKRSKMLKIIYNEIEFDIDADLSSSAQAEYLAEVVLNVVEANGMYPPCRRDGKFDWDDEDAIVKD